MGKAKTLDQPGRNRLILAAVKRTGSWAEPAREFNLTLERIRQIALTMEPDLDILQLRVELKKAAHEKDIRKLMAEGCVTVEELAQQMGVHERVMQVWLNDLDIDLPL